MVYLNNQHNFIQSDFNEKPRFKKRRLGIVVLILSFVVIGYFLGGKSNTVEVKNESGTIRNNKSKVTISS